MGGAGQGDIDHRSRRLPSRAAAESLAELGVRRGDVLSGKYRVDAAIARGGTGVVVAATNLSLQKRVALKLLSRPQRARRFKREARAGAALDREHVVEVLDDGVHAGIFYLVMELLIGADLRAELRERGRFSLVDAADYLVQACHALAAAHASGVVHRDLKPENLFLAERGDGTVVIKVLDFSHAKVVDADEHLTQEGEQLGTLGYMSPEQYDAPRDVGFQADVWSLGVLLFELLAGHRPFRAHGGNKWEESQRIRKDDPDRLHDEIADVPADVEALIADALVKDRAERGRRIPDVGAFARRLAPFGSDRARALVPRIERILASKGPSSAAPTGAALAPSRGDTLSTAGSESSGAAQASADEGQTVEVGVTASAPPRHDASPTPARAPRRPHRRAAAGIAAVLVTATAAVGYRASSQEAGVPAAAPAMIHVNTPLPPKPSSTFDTTSSAPTAEPAAALPSASVDAAPPHITAPAHPGHHVSDRAVAQGPSASGAARVTTPGKPTRPSPMTDPLDDPD